MKKFIVVLMFVALTSTGAMAAGALKNNVGCGIGTLIFETAGLNNGGWLLQSTADYTNAFFSASWTMTTGTLNCQGNINKAVSVELYEFVTANMDDLARDVAMGQGATIDSLAAMLGVNDKVAFSSALQANFSVIFPDSNVQSADVANKIVSLS